MPWHFMREDKIRVPESKMTWINQRILNSRAIRARGRAEALVGIVAL